MLGSAFLPFRDSCHILPPLATSRNLFRLLASSSSCIPKMDQNGLCQRTQWVDPAWRHSEPASWSSRSAPMCTAPHMFVPRSSQASCRVNFLWKFGRIVHKRWQETWRQERISSYEKLHFLPFSSFFHDQLKKLALVLKDERSNDVVQVRMRFGHELGKGNIKETRRVWWTVAVMISMILRIWSKGIISKGCLGVPAAVGKQDQFSKKSRSQRRSRWTLWWRFLCQPSFVLWDDHPGSDALVDTAWYSIITALWCIYATF